MRRSVIGASLMLVLGGCDVAFKQAFAAEQPCEDRFMANFKPLIGGPVRARYSFDISKAGKEVHRSIAARGLNGQMPHLIATNARLDTVDAEQIDAQSAKGVIIHASDAKLYVFEDARAFDASKIRTELAARCAAFGPGTALREVRLTSVR